MREIKPCPFCGSVEAVRVVPDFYVNQWLEQEVEYQVVCSGETTKTGCGSSSGFHDTEEKAIEAWNRAWNRRNEQWIKMTVGQKESQRNT